MVHDNIMSYTTAEIGINKFANIICACYNTLHISQQSLSLFLKSITTHKMVEFWI